jgi:hypothetical protein
MVLRIVYSLLSKIVKALFSDENRRCKNTHPNLGGGRVM